jgi:hypothetical protein
MESQLKKTDDVQTYVGARGLAYDPEKVAEDGKMIYTQGEILGDPADARTNGARCPSGS